MDALITRLRAPRTLGVTVMRMLFVRTLGFASVVVVVLIGSVMSMQASAAPLDNAPIQLPSWTAGDEVTYPGCVDAAEWPAGELSTAVVAHSFLDGTVSKVAFDKAWDANHNSSDVDDLWVLGICA